MSARRTLINLFPSEEQGRCCGSVLNQFQTYEPSIEDTSRKQIEIDNRTCLVEIWDTVRPGSYTCALVGRVANPLTRITLQKSAGHHQMCPYGASVSLNVQIRRLTLRLLLHNREGQGFVLLYSIASRETFERIEVYYQRMLRVKTEPPVFILVGNKCDVARREVSREEGERRAQALGCQFFETSAKTAYNVEKVFLTLVRLLRVEQHPAATDVSEKSKRKLKLRCVLM